MIANIPIDLIITSVINTSSRPYSFLEPIGFRRYLVLSQVQDNRQSAKAARAIDSQLVLLYRSEHTFRSRVDFALSAHIIFIQA